MTPAQIKAHERRFKSRREMQDGETLKRGDMVWRDSNWHPIAKEHIGLLVGSMSAVYGMKTRPTFGTKRDA